MIIEVRSQRSDSTARPHVYTTRRGDWLVFVQPGLYRVQRQGRYHLRSFRVLGVR